MAKICPCQREMKYDSFLYFVYFLDIFQMLGMLTFFMPLIGLIIFCKDGTFISGFHRCYAWFRISFFIAMMVLFSTLTTIMIILKKNNKQLPEKLRYLENDSMFIITSAIYISIISWNIYLSMGFLEASVVMEKDVERAVIVNDVETRMREDEGDPAEKVTPVAV